MGLFGGSKSSSTSSQEDNRISADHSFVAQVRSVGGDLIFTDQGALELGERGLDLAGKAIAQSLAAQTEAGRGELDGVLGRILGAAVPITIVALVVWGLRK